MEIDGTITLYQAVKDFQHLTGRGDKDFGRLLNMAVMCLRDLNMFATNRIKTYKINTSEITNDLGKIDYPSDALSIFGVFVNYNNTLYPLIERTDAIFTDSYGVYNKEIGEGETPNNHYHSDFANRGAVGSWYFYDDNDKRVITILGQGDVQLWIQYVAGGVDKDKGAMTVLPAYYEEAIHSYILYKEALMHRKGDKNAVPFLFNEYRKARNKIRTSEMPGVQKYRDALYSVWRRTPKR